MSQVLVIARNASVRDQLRQVVQESGVSVDTLEDFEPAYAAIQKDPPVLVLAENPPDDETMEKLSKTILSSAPVTPLLLYLSERDSRLALKRMSAGAFDCLCPPLTPGDFLAAAKRSVSRLGRRLLSSRQVQSAAWWRQPATYISLGFVIFLGLLGLGLFGLWAPPFQMYRLASDHPVGVAGDKDTVWVADWSQQNITGMIVQGDYVSIVQVHKLQDFQPVAVAFAPFYVYTISSDGRLRRHRRDDALSVAASVAAPDSSPTGLAWDGDTLWSCDSATGKIYEHDAGLAVKSSFQSQVKKPVGLAWHKKALWVADGEKNALWKMTPKGTEWDVKGPLPLEVFAHNNDLRLSGFTIWKDRVWIVSESGGVLMQHRLPDK